MTKLILNTNYLLQADNISCPKNIRKNLTSIINL